MNTDTPTLHDLLEVSAAIGAEMGGWGKDSKGWMSRVLVMDRGGSGPFEQRKGALDAAPDELDAQVGRLVKRLLTLYIQPEDFGGEWYWSYLDAKKPATKWEVHHLDYTTAVYLAAKKVEEAK